MTQSVMAEGQPTSKNKQEDGPDPGAPHAQAGGQAGKPLVWYCPSRWLLAHNDTQANICTQSSHMCLADLNNDGENLLALVDFKDATPPVDSAADRLAPGSRPPYACRMRVYRGQQLIYNHFLEDVPSSLIATSVNLPLVAPPTTRTKLGSLGSGASRLADTLKQQTLSGSQQQQQPLLTLAINEDVYFYHKLKPSHKLSLEDEECILDSLNKSEVDAWEMARKNQIEDGTMRELLLSLSQELGNQALTSHSNNFIALASSDERKQYLVNWKLKRLASSSSSSSSRLGEQLMSMDTVCCSAARLKFNSTLTTSGDYGQTRERTTIVNNADWNHLINMQRDGLVLGTEDRHLLIFELRAVRTRLESHCRLPAVADHIMVERRSPASLHVTQPRRQPPVTGKQFDLRAISYKILISCRDRKIYSLDQPYIVSDGSKSIPASALRELVALKCNVLDMCWTGMNEAEPSQRGGTPPSGGSPGVEHHWPTFVVACLDRRFYCFGSHSGQCKWVMEMELPITCLVCLPQLTIGSDEASLVGVASQANRFDFYVATTGRIVDSIYFQDDFPVAAKFGRFGREDNCLCLTSQLGHLLVFILKRSAKFGHGQCLSSAASYASDTLASCGKILKRSAAQSGRAASDAAPTGAESGTTRAMKLHEQVNLPSAFDLSKSKSVNATDKILDSLILSHDCDQATAKNALDAHATRPQLQIPMKGRDFVNQIVDQSRLSRQSGRLFAKQMVGLRDKVKLALGQYQQQTCGDEVNRVSLTKTTGLGNVYRVSLALRLDVADFVTRYHDLLHDKRYNSTSPNASPSWELTCYITPKKEVQNRSCQVSPFKFKLPIEVDSKADLGIKSILESAVVIKLLIRGQAFEPLDGDNLPIEVKVIAHHFSPSAGVTTVQRPLYLTTINVPLTF